MTLLWLFLVGEYRLPFQTISIGETVWRGAGRDWYHRPINYEIPVEGRIPAVLVRGINPACNDNEARNDSPIQEL